MAKGTRICKVCGKEYPYCKTHAPANKFRWQDVACSIECGSTYFKLVEEARRKDNVAETSSDVETEVATEENENNGVYADVVDNDDDTYESTEDEDSDDEDETDYDDEYDEIDDDIAE